MGADQRTIAEKKAAYEKSGMKDLMELHGHQVCDRCYCCDAFSESTTCWCCNGFPEEDEYDGFPPSICPECGDDGELFYMVCAGNCDENGNHKQSPCVGPGPIPPSLATENECVDEKDF